MLVSFGDFFASKFKVRFIYNFFLNLLLPSFHINIILDMLEWFADFPLLFPGEKFTSKIDLEKKKIESKKTVDLVG